MTIRHLSIGISLALLAAGCSSSSPCKRACRKIEQCLNPTAPSTDGGATKTDPQDSTNPVGEGTTSTNADPAPLPGGDDGKTTGGSNTTGSCSFSAECSPLEECQAKCITGAPCEAFTDTSSAAAAALASCQAACGSSTADAAVPSDGGPDKSVVVTEAGTPDADITISPDQYVQPQPDVHVQPKPDLYIPPTPDACVPNCSGKQCGSNGCGGTCGSCPSGYSCTLFGTCEANTTGCGSITYEGCCDGTTVKYCDSGQLQTADCSSTPGYVCGWNAGSAFYDCTTSATPDPSGVHPMACP